MAFKTQEITESLSLDALKSKKKKKKNNLNCIQCDIIYIYDGKKYIILNIYKYYNLR